MMYPFMTLNDDTEITHSELRPDGTVKVYVETPTSVTVSTAPCAGSRPTDGMTCVAIPQPRWPTSSVSCAPTPT